MEISTGYTLTYLRNKMTDLMEQLHEMDGSEESVLNAYSEYNIQMSLIAEMIEELEELEYEFNLQQERGNDDYA